MATKFQDRLRERIIKDIGGINKTLFDLDRNQDKNFGVLDGNYLMVWQTEEVLPMNHERGSFNYYEILRDSLVRVVSYDFLDHNLLIDAHSPDYLKQFLGFNIQRHS